MTNSINCDECARSLAGVLERDVDEVTRSALEAHALSCAECGPLLADLRRLRIDAQNLPELAPSHDLWVGIAARIEAPVVPIERWEPGEREGQAEQIGSRGRNRRTRRYLGIWWPAAAAAAALVAVTAGVTYVATRSAVTGHPAQAVARGPVAASVGAPVPPESTVTGGTESATTPLGTAPSARLVSNVKRLSAEATYGQEIERLRAILGQRRSQLDTGTVHVIERNLRVIDDAIGQCRVALAKDPASRFLLESLNTALETKIELLRTAASLPSHS